MTSRNRRDWDPTKSTTGEPAGSDRYRDMPSNQSKRSTFSVFGVLCLGVLTLGLIATAVLTGGPRRSTASPEKEPIVPPGKVVWNAEGTRVPDRVLCELVGVQFRVRVVTGEDGPRYTVLSLEGNVLFEHGTLSEITAAFPTLDLATMRDAEGKAYGPLMLMDVEK